MYFLKPFNKHYDYGFGAYADAYKRAADLLWEQQEQGNKILNAHLPINYLYRHAIELYLKSVIIVLHKRLKISFGENNPNGYLHILVNQKWEPIHKVHSVAKLFQYFKNLISENSSRIKSITGTDWSDIPVELDTEINDIELTDSRSTYLRYPDLNNISNEEEKSSFKNSTPYEIFKSMAPGNEPAKSFFVLDDNDQITESYLLDNVPMSDMTAKLKNVAMLLEGTHFGFRMELAGGE